MHTQLCTMLTGNDTEKAGIWKPVHTETGKNAHVRLCMLQRPLTPPCNLMGGQRASGDVYVPPHRSSSTCKLPGVQ